VTTGSWKDRVAQLPLQTSQTFTESYLASIPESQAVPFTKRGMVAIQQYYPHHSYYRYHHHYRHRRRHRHHPRHHPRHHRPRPRHHHYCCHFCYHHHQPC